MKTRIVKWDNCNGHTAFKMVVTENHLGKRWAVPVGWKPSTMWYRIIKRVFKRDDHTCQYCGKVGGKLECDHIVPISKGGSNNENNLNTACQKCNRQKKDKSVKEFKEWKNDR